MSWAALAGTLASTGGSLASAFMGQDAQSEAIAAANAQQAAGLRGQQGLVNQQLALADRQLALSRPLLETRDNALNALSSIFGLPAISPAAQQSVAGAVNDPLVRTGDRAPVPIPGLTYHDRVSGGPNVRGEVLFDPVDQNFVDRAGNVLAPYTGDGELPFPFVQGADNRVEIRDGRIIGVGNTGEVDVFGIPARPESPAAATPEAATRAAGGMDTSNFNFASLINTPQLDFQRQEGERQLERILNARGLRNSGRELDSLTRLNEGLVNQRVDSVVNNLFRMAGFGSQGLQGSQNALSGAQGALGGLGSAIGANASNMGNLALQQGQVRSSTLADLGTIGGNFFGDLVQLGAQGNLPWMGNQQQPGMGGYGSRPGEQGEWWM